MTPARAPDHSPARRARSRTPLDPARQVAFAALRSVDDQDAYLNLTLPTLLAGAGLGGRDAAFATELANGTVRMQGRYDAILATCLKGGTAALQPEVLTALRLGTHQLLGMRVPAHAAVGTSVELVRESVGERPVRLVNAVLRRVGSTSLDDWLDLVAPLPADGHVATRALSTRFSHPVWVVEAFADALAADGAPATELPMLLEADNDAPAVTLAVRPGLATIAQLSSYGVQPGRFSPYAGRLPGGDPHDLAEIRSGRVGVQDEGSQLVALVAARVRVDGRDTRWLDMCAGPGGKAALLTGLARERGGSLVAAERLPHRASLVGHALQAYPPPHPVIAADGTRPAWRPDAFDRMVVDAPCSGLGALRRRPEARWRRTPDDLRQLVPLQESLLSSALDSVRPGGVVVYVTCTPHLAESRGVVDAALGTRSDVNEEDARALLPEVPDVGPGPHVQLWPHRHGTDAMFVAVLRRAD